MNYVALVDDRSFGAQNRLNSLNMPGTPTTYFDAGDTCFVGGYPQEYYYRDRIEAVGTRVVPDIDLRVKMDYIGGAEYTITVKIGNGVSANADPNDPPQPFGPIYTAMDIPTEFEATITDPDADDLYYQFDWGDGEITDWLGPVSSGTKVVESHSWSTENNYDVAIRVKDIWDATTDWSPVNSIAVGCCFDIRGNIDATPSPDVEGAGGIDIADLVFIVAYSFNSGPEPSCIAEADIDGSGGAIPIDIADIVYLVNFMFAGGPVPALCF